MDWWIVGLKETITQSHNPTISQSHNLTIPQSPNPTISQSSAVSARSPSGAARRVASTRSRASTAAASRSRPTPPTASPSICETRRTPLLSAVGRVPTSQAEISSTLAKNLLPRSFSDAHTRKSVVSSMIKKRSWKFLLVRTVRPPCATHHLDPLADKPTMLSRFIYRLHRALHYYVNATVSTGSLLITVSDTHHGNSPHNNTFIFNNTSPRSCMPSQRPPGP